MKHQKSCLDCDSIIYTTIDPPICGPCQRVRDGKQTGVQNTDRRTWRTVSLVGWGLLFFGLIGLVSGFGAPSNPNSGSAMQMGLVVLLVSPFVIIAGKMGATWAKK